VHDSIMDTETLRLLHNLIKIGRISHIDSANALVRVACGDIETNWLHILFPAAGDTKHWRMPSVGEQCIIFSPGGEVDQGIVLAGLFYEGNETPSNNKAETYIKFKDDSTIIYNDETHELTASIKGKIIAQATDDISIITEKNCIVNAMDINATATGAVVVKATQASVEAATILLKGNVSVVGNFSLAGAFVAAAGASGGGASIAGALEVGSIESQGDVVASGISLTGHTHNDAQGGDVGPAK
jgi:phage baseplate assembly protein V